MKLALSWQVLALLSALCAALSAIFAKLGVASVNPDLATFIRTLIIIAVLAGFLSLTGQWQSVDNLTPRAWMVLGLSALASGASWLFYFRALQAGDAARVAPLDKMSLVLVAVFATVFLGERLSTLNWLGIGLVTGGVVLVALR
jgi:bacterial/archaeal transporter family protein